jgi:FKBP-type peptidyl-prolyl cis-trans isomerase 2
MGQKNIALIALVAVLLAAVAAGCTSSSPVAKMGDNVTIDYTMKLPNGSLVDTSVKQVAIDAGKYVETRKYQPYSFIVGSSAVIQGMSDAVLGMKVGETKNGTIPPEKAYGVYNSSDIRPFSIKAIEGDNNTLVVGQALVGTVNGRSQYVYVYSIDEANDTVYVDYNNKMAGLSFEYQVTLLKIG